MAQLFAQHKRLGSCAQSCKDKDMPTADRRALLAWLAAGGGGPVNIS